MNFIFYTKNILSRLWVIYFLDSVWSEESIGLTIMFTFFFFFSMNTSLSRNIGPKVFIQQLCQLKIACRSHFRRVIFHSFQYFFSGVRKNLPKNRIKTAKFALNAGRSCKVPISKINTLSFKYKIA